MESIVGMEAGRNLSRFVDVSNVGKILLIEWVPATLSGNILGALAGCHSGENILVEIW